MKVTITIGLLLVSIGLLAQQEKQGLPISVAYFGAYAIQPGIKVGTSFDWKEWQSSKSDKTIFKSYFISPQLGYFVRANNHNSFIINADIGYKRTKGTGKFYSAPSIGLGYILASQILSNTVNLGTTINYEFGSGIF